MINLTDMPGWTQLALNALFVFVVLAIAAILIALAADLSYEVRRDRAKSRRADTGMIRPLRLQQQRVAGWRTPDESVRVGRGTDWGNPWKVGDLVALPKFDGSVRVTEQLAVDLFAAWVTQRGWIDEMTDELAGRDLVCWCKIGAPCHADWILETVNPPRTLADVDAFPTELNGHKYLTQDVPAA